MVGFNAFFRVTFEGLRFRVFKGFKGLGCKAWGLGGFKGWSFGV